MKKKRGQRLIAMLLTAAIMTGTLETTGLAQTMDTGAARADQSVQTGTGTSEQKKEVALPQRAKDWTGEFETVTSQAEAEALRTQDESKNLLIATEDCTLSGLKFGEIATTETKQLDLSEITAKVLDIDQAQDVQLRGTKLDQLYIQTEEGQKVSLHMDADTQIPEIIVKGTGSVQIEGNSALGIVRVTEAAEKVTVRATCSVLNESGQNIDLETPDGEQLSLLAGQQKELVLSSYLVTFMADGQVYESKTVKPGENISFPEKNPEKEGYLFTSWYLDEAFTENCSQFQVAEGETTLYARFVEESEAIKVTFDTMGGRELQPQMFAKGETLLTRPISEIYTEKEGYTFGGWCIDPECTTAFSYTEPLEESVTLYAFFVSEEAQTVEKDSTSVDLKDFDWQGTISLRTQEEMTLEEVKQHVRVEVGSGELQPELDITESGDGFVISGSYYEKDGQKGFEPGATFSIILSDGVRFADYSDDTDTVVVSVYKEQVEIVGFSQDMTYVLWDDVMEYHPVTEVKDASEDTTADEDAVVSEDTNASETTTVSEDTAASGDITASDDATASEEQATSEDTAVGEETADNQETSEIEEVANTEDTTAEILPQTTSDPDGEDVPEQDEAAYTPGELLVKDTTSYEVGDIVAFYDGEIGRDEKNIDAYTDGSFDGYVLFAQILSVEDTKDGTRLTYGYANPEDYLADFDVHITDDVEMDQQLSDDDLEVLTSRLSRQVEENEELKAQMLISVMTAPETQGMLDDLYGEGTYALAGMTADLLPGKPVVKLSVSGSEVTATISISATATIKKDGKTMLTVQPKLTFTQSLSVQTNVNGGKIWIDMSVTIRSMSKIELTVTASSGGKASVFTKAADSLSEIVKPEGIPEGQYETYDKAVSDLMDTMNSIVSTSLKYNDLFDILLLNLKFSFYGIITVGFEVHLVGQVGVLATFGVEIVARSGERIGFKYNFLKFKGSSYTEKLESSVTNNIYLIGKVGARVGLRLTLSVTMCGIASAYITGSLYAYAELTGLFFNTTNLLSGANTNLGALNFEVGIDVVVSLGLKVKLIFKTIRKNWTVYTGRWPLWSTSVSSQMTYMDEDELAKMWEKTIANADHKTVFGFDSIPMKTWDLMGGECVKNSLLTAEAAGKGAKISLAIKNLTVNGEAVAAGDPKNGLFTVGDSSKGRNPGYIYMDEDLAEKELCEETELDVVVTYENNSSSALVKKQTKTFHLKKKCALATTTHNVKIVLNDWCARNWGLESAAWDNQTVYETSFTSTHRLGGGYEPTATGTLNLGEIISAAQSQYPELVQYTCQWTAPSASDGGIMQYSVPQISNFCYMTPANGVVRYDVRPQTDAYEVTYYLFVRRFEGNEDTIRYHINLEGNAEEDTYAFQVTPSSYSEALTFAKESEHTYLLEAHRTQFDGNDQPLMMSVNGEAAANTGFTLNGREQQQDVYFDITIGKIMLGIQTGEGIKGYQFTDPSLQTEEGVKAGSKVELQVELEEGYGGLEVTSENEEIQFQIENNKVSFVMPTRDLSITLRAYKLHSITYLYQYGGYDTYQTVYFAENEQTTEVTAPEIEGLTFRGWYTTPDYTGEPYVFGEKLETDVTLYADWTCNVTVHFTPAKGTASYWSGQGEDRQEIYLFENDTNEYYSFTYSTLRPGEKLLDIQVPEYEGYQFMGWYSNAEFTGEPVEPENYLVSGGMDLYANWAKMVSVVFDKNDGSEETFYTEVTGLVGYPLTLLPEEPTREYYSFSGWYQNKATTVGFDASNEKITGATTLYAGWRANRYPITYDLGGGTETTANPADYTTEESFTLTDPVREGYTFEGWTGTGLDEVTKNVTVTAGNGGDRNYTAVWTPITYTLRYERTFGTAEGNPQFYNIESEDIILEQPEREKYTFIGWIGTGLEEPTLSVSIPKGSTGDRIYTAVWTTDDPILDILEQVELLANDHPYEDELIHFLSQEDFMKDEISYEALTEKLKEKVESYLSDLIKNDEKIGAYSDHIQLTVTWDKEFTDFYSDSEKQKYGFGITAIYVDDDGVQTPEEPAAFLYSATLKKMVPTVFWPEPTKILYGQQVVMAEPADGMAQFVHEEMELPISGTFDWNAEEKDKVPFGLDNGTENSYYKITFTPDRADCFAPVEGTAEIDTQIGVALICEAEDRDYIPGNLETTGKISLVYVDQNGNPTDTACEVEGLLSGTIIWSFDDDKAEVDKNVTVTGYSLDEQAGTSPEYGENAYVLVGGDVKTCQATIYPVQQENAKIQVTAPETAETSYLYGKVLGDVALVNGSVTYQISDTDAVSIEGTWDWKNADKELTPNAGENTYTVLFTPADKYQGGYGTFEAQVTVRIEKIQIDVPAVEDLTYNGSSQSANVSATGYYTVKENPSVTAAGTYTVKLELRDSVNYAWAGSSNDKVVIDGAVAAISYQILPAEILVNTDRAAVEPVMYGQKLTGEDTNQKATVNGVENVTTELTAKGKVSGFTVVYKDNTAQSVTTGGTWSWLTDENGNVTVKTANGDTSMAQPLKVGTYQIKAKFTPNDTNLKPYESYLPVTVQKSNPYVPYELNTDNFYMPEGEYFTLKYIEIKEKDRSLYNAYTGEEIKGQWDWVDPETISYTDGEFSAKFTISGDAADSYIQPGTTCGVYIRADIIIKLAFLAKGGVVLSEGELSDPNKYGLKGEDLTAEIWYYSKSSEKTIIRSVDFWKNAWDNTGYNILEPARMRIESSQMFCNKVYNNQYDLCASDSYSLSIDHIGDLTDWYNVTLTFNEIPKGDVNLVIFVPNAGTAYDTSDPIIMSAPVTEEPTVPGTDGTNAAVEEPTVPGTSGTEPTPAEPTVPGTNGSQTPAETPGADSSIPEPTVPGTSGTNEPAEPTVPGTNGSQTPAETPGADSSISETPTPEPAQPDSSISITPSPETPVPEVSEGVEDTESSDICEKAS